MKGNEKKKKELKKQSLTAQPPRCRATIRKIRHASQSLNLLYSNPKNRDMIQVKREGVVLEKTTHEFETDSVLNPAVIAQSDTLHMFYRAVKEHNKSSIGYCRLERAMNVVERYAQPMLSPQADYECNGMEDPRIVHIEGFYYMTYTAIYKVVPEAFLTWILTSNRIEGKRLRSI